MSGGNTGYVEVLQFASCTPNIGPYMEYKGNINKSKRWYDPPLTLKDGEIHVPKGPGLGLTIDPDVLKDLRVLQQSTKIALDHQGIIAYWESYGRGGAEEWRELFADLIERAGG